MNWSTSVVTVYASIHDKGREVEAQFSNRRRLKLDVAYTINDRVWDPNRLLTAPLI